MSAPLACKGRAARRHPNQPGLGDRREFTVGSAGGENAYIEAAYGEAAVPDGVAAYNVGVSGLKGGHSGVDINLGRVTRQTAGPLLEGGRR